MGKEANVTAILADGADEGRLQYEAPKLTFKGRERRVFDAEALKGVQADGGDLVLADGSRFALGERAAKGWADAILNPKTRLDKIGVKPGLRTAVIGVADKTFTQELGAAGAVPVTELKDVDLLFYAADSEAELARIADLIPALGEGGALWVVSKKGKAATVKDVQVLEAVRGAGLVDNKVAAFSATLTALRFVRPKVVAAAPAQP